MTTLRNQLTRLLSTGRGKGRLRGAAVRDAIGISRSVGYNSGAEGGGGGGWASPITEQINSPASYNLTSSDGLFTIEIPEQTTYQDAVSDQYTIVHKDPNA